MVDINKNLITRMYKLFYFLVFCFVVSCGPSRNLVYFSDLNENAEQSAKILNLPDTKIQPDDILSISVSTLNPESNALFNSGILLPTVTTLNNPTSTLVKEGYLVDKNGFISFPVLGQVKLGGLSKEEATRKMVTELKRYIKGEPLVNIRFLNFKVTVIGEVNNPSTLTISSDKINILEALGMAGDMTPYGKRENVLIIREKEGKRNITRINLNNKEALNSPYFYLQQNDVVYVEPSKAKALAASTNRAYLPIITAATSLITIVIVRFFR